MNHYQVKSSGYKTADAVIVPGSQGATGGGGPEGNLHAVQLLSDASNACSVIIYDGVAAVAGKEVAVLSIAASTTAPTNIVFNNPVQCSNGIYADVTGTGATYIVHYSLG